MDEDNSDIFVHQDDLIQGGFSLEILKTLKKVDFLIKGAIIKT